MGSHRYVALSAILVWVALPAIAHGEPGEGFRAGNLKVSPSLTTSGTVDGNVYRAAPSEVGNSDGVIGAPILSIGPGLAITTPNPANFDFNLDASASWEQYLSSDRRVRQQSGLKASLGAEGTINPEGDISFKLVENLTLTNEPPAYPTSVSYNRFLNEFGGTLGIHPGPRILNLNLGYRLSLHRNITPVLRGLDKDSHDFNLDFTWKFLPRTSFVIQGNASLIRYQEEERFGFGRTGLRNNNSEHLGVKGGLSGLLTRRVTARLLGGYSHGFYEEHGDFYGFVADASVGYLLGNVDKDNSVRLGYKLDYKDSYLGNWVLEHKADLSYTQKFVDGRFQVNGGLDYTYRDYSSLPLPAGDNINEKEVRNRLGDTLGVPADPEDNLFGVNAGVTANIYEWWSATLSYQFKWNSTSDSITIDRVSGEGPDYLRNFRRHVGTLSTTVRY